MSGKADRDLLIVAAEGGIIDKEKQYAGAIDTNSNVEVMSKGRLRRGSCEIEGSGGIQWILIVI